MAHPTAIDPTDKGGCDGERVELQLATGRGGWFAQYLHLGGAGTKRGDDTCVTVSAKLSKAAFTATVRRIPDNPGLAVAYRLIWKHRATSQLFVDLVPAGIRRLLATFPCVPNPEDPSPLRTDGCVAYPSPSACLRSPPACAAQGYPGSPTSGPRFCPGGTRHAPTASVLRPNAMHQCFGPRGGGAAKEELRDGECKAI